MFSSFFFPCSIRQSTRNVFCFVTYCLSHKISSLEWAVCFLQFDITESVLQISLRYVRPTSTDLLILVDSIRFVCFVSWNLTCRFHNAESILIHVDCLFHFCWNTFFVSSGELFITISALVILTWNFRMTDWASP